MQSERKKNREIRYKTWLYLSWSSYLCQKKIVIPFLYFSHNMNISVNMWFDIFSSTTYNEFKEKVVVF